jgi:hypothetical protein
MPHRGVTPLSSVKMSVQQFIKLPPYCFIFASGRIREDRGVCIKRDITAVYTFESKIPMRDRFCRDVNLASLRWNDPQVQRFCAQRISPNGAPAVKSIIASRGQVSTPIREKHEKGIFQASWLADYTGFCESRLSGFRFSLVGGGISAITLRMRRSKHFSAR